MNGRPVAKKPPSAKSKSTTYFAKPASFKVRQTNINRKGCHTNAKRYNFMANKPIISISKNTVIEQLTHMVDMEKSKIALLVFCFVVGVSTTAICQSESPRIIAGISLGSAVPTGKFADTNILDEKAGFAKKGYAYGVDGAYFLDKNYGVCAAVRIGSHPMDVQKIANGYAEILGGIFTVNAERWYRFDMYAGACVTIPINKLHIDLKMMPGISNLAYPELRAESDQYSFYQFTEPTKSIGFCASGTVRYTLTEVFSLAAFAETNRTKTTFNVQLEFNGSDEIYSVDQPVSINTFGLSLYYNIY